MITWLGNRSLLFLISSAFGLLYVGLMVGFFHNEIGTTIINTKTSIIVSYEEYQENNRLQEIREEEMREAEMNIKLYKEKKYEELRRLKKLQVEENIRLENARKLMEENKKKEKSRDIFCLFTPCWVL